MKWSQLLYIAQFCPFVSDHQKWHLWKVKKKINSSTVYKKQPRREKELPAYMPLTYKAMYTNPQVSTNTANWRTGVAVNSGIQNMEWLSHKCGTFRISLYIKVTSEGSRGIYISFRFEKCLALNLQNRVRKQVYEREGYLYKFLLFWGLQSFSAALACMIHT